MHRSGGRSVRASQEANVQETKPEQRWKIRAGISADAGAGRGKRGAVSGRVGSVGKASRQSRERKRAAPGPRERKTLFLLRLRGASRLSSAPLSWRQFRSLLGAVFKPLGASLEPLRDLVEASWGHLGSLVGASWGPLGASWGLLGGLRVVFGNVGGSGGRLEAILVHPRSKTWVG